MDGTAFAPVGIFNDTQQRIAAVALTGVVGVLAWSGAPYLLPLALALFALWAGAPTRLAGWLIALVYYLAASRDLPISSMAFFGSGFSSGLALWVLSALLLSAPFALLWAKRITTSRVLLLLLLVVLPPIGLVGYANPLTAAGLLFPGWGWLGLAATVTVVVWLVRVPRLAWLLPLASVMPWAHVTPGSPPGWAALNTAYVMTSGQRAFMADARRQRELAARVSVAEARVLVLPETIAGRWSPSSSLLWGDAMAQVQAQGRTVLLGAELGESGEYHNTVISLKDQGQPVYRQLMPAPLSMWRPWAADGAIAHWFAPQSLRVDDEQAAFLICYEQILLWPPLVAFATGPTVLVGLSNDWWARDTRLPAIQHAVMTAWARLFGVALVEAVNR